MKKGKYFSSLEKCPMNSVTQLFSYSVIQLFSYSVIQLLSYSVTQLLSYSVTQLLTELCQILYMNAIPLEVVSRCLSVRFR